MKMYKKQTLTFTKVGVIFYDFSSIFYRKYKQIKKKRCGMQRNKISVYDNDGRTRDERETCFPKNTQKQERKGAGI